MTGRVYTVCEYDSFTRGETSVEGYYALSPSTFDALERFVLCNAEKDDALSFMGLSARKGVGKLLTAKNYVGVIAMKDGTVIEILPKIVSVGEDLEKVKTVFTDMLKTLRDFPSKTFGFSKMQVKNMPIFEVFIRMFIEELFVLTKGGIRSDYEEKEENLSVFKGKIKQKEQIIQNYIHKERCYATFEEFTENVPENAILKTTLLLLRKNTRSNVNKRDLSILLTSFENVRESVDVTADFSKVKRDRSTKAYERALSWCRIFLSGRSYTSFAGSEVSVALLFPMEKLFESYVATFIQKRLDFDEYEVRLQDGGYYLFDAPKKFALRPDIVVRRKADGATYVLDTKWKLLFQESRDYGISRADMYQMYAYHQKYENTQSVTLLYPYTRAVPKDKNISYRSEEGVCVNVRFIDPANVRQSIESCLQNLLV